MFGYPGRINDSRLEEVFILLRDCIETKLGTLFTNRPNFFNHHGAIKARVFGDGPGGFFQGAVNDFRTDLFVFVQLLYQVCNDLLAAKQRDTTTRNNAIGNGCAGGMQSIFNPALGLFHFGFGGSTDANDGNPARQLGKAFGELFLVIVRLGLVHLFADLGNSLLDAVLAGRIHLAHHNGAGFPLHGDLFGCAQMFKGYILDFDTEVFADKSSTGKNRDVAKNGAPTIAKPGSFDRHDFENTAHFVDNQGGKRLAFNIFRDDDEFSASLCDLLKHGNHFTDIVELLLIDQDERIVHLGAHVLWIVDEVRRDVALVELHALDEFKRGLGGFSLFNGDDSVFAYFLEGLGHHVADFAIIIGADRGDLSHLFGGGHGLGELGKFFNHFLHGLVDTFFNRHRVGTRGNVAKAFLVHGQT